MELTQLTLTISNIQLLLAFAIVLFILLIENDKLAINIIHCVIVGVMSVLQIVNTIIQYCITGEDYKISLLLSFLWIIDFVIYLIYVIKKGKNLKDCKQKTT